MFVLRGAIDEFMISSCQTIPYSATGYFSKLVLDYLNGEPALKPFYEYQPDLDGIKQAIEVRKQFRQNRGLLVDALKQQYQGLEISDRVHANIDALLRPTTFTVTTAHQPNIFTGPLYFIYKILHAIKLAETLRKEMPEYEFVPMYYMGCEDADLDELGHIFLSGEKVSWQTNQTGAVGRMNTKGLDAIINRLEGEFGHLPFAGDMLAICRQAYTKHSNIQQATVYLLNELFKDYGLVILMPDSALLKSAFVPVLEKELFERFSHPLVQQTAAAIGEQYKVQTAGREINLFYLQEDGSRERIEYIQTNDGESWQVVNTGLSFTKETLLKILHQHPERFSPNVILRGVFQETVLPNIAFIGGGGELAYWMELKKVFEAAGVPYPVLLLRNSFLLVDAKQKALQQKLALDYLNLFKPASALLTDYTLQQASADLSTKAAQQIANQLYKKLQEQASGIDATLKPHVAALHVATLKGLINLEKKFLRAEKRKHSSYASQLEKLKAALFPANNLQERIDNFMPLYAQYGKEILDVLYACSQPFAEEFTVVEIS